MNTLDKQLKGIIEDSISKTMNIKIPIQSNEAERNLLLQIINNQAEIKREIASLRMEIAQLRSDISVIKHHHEYYC